ncbi:MAG TPA: hypothetical protein VFS21_27490 [Roseiflexaceae bacterium]|nr:hypothetical protein [Roseiflexaceae bacterium]
MAATNPVANLEMMGFCLGETLAQLGVTERVSERLEAGLLFDVACQLQAARSALEVAQGLINAHIQPEEQARAVGA